MGMARHISPLRVTDESRLSPNDGRRVVIVSTADSLHTYVGMHRWIAIGRMGAVPNVLCVLYLSVPNGSAQP